MSKKIFVGSTPFVPCGFDGKVLVRHCTVAEIREIIVDSGMEIISYCGHEASARFLGVPMNRGQAPLPVEDEHWVGIRPTRRPAPGEELDPADTDSFVGWEMLVRPAHGLLGPYPLPILP